MKAVVISNKQDAYNVKILRIKPEKHIDFKSGQFIFMHYNLVNNGVSRVVKRAYSVTSLPYNKDYIELAFYMKPDGLVSKYMYSLKKGNVVEISGPGGFFMFEDSVKDNLILIGGGTGIAPLISIIRYVIDKKFPNKLKLIYSCKTSKNIIYKKELDNLKKLSKNFDYTITLSREEKKDYLNGHINIDMVKSLVKDINKNKFYICGPPKMVIDMSEMLQEAGIPKENIKTEGYS